MWYRTVYNQIIPDRDCKSRIPANFANPEIPGLNTRNPGIFGIEKFPMCSLLCETRSSADADNRLDAFSGQSRSTNMVPFHM